MAETPTKFGLLSVLRGRIHLPRAPWGERFLFTVVRGSIGMLVSRCNSIFQSVLRDEKLEYVGWQITLIFRIGKKREFVFQLTCMQAFLWFLFYSFVIATQNVWKPHPIFMLIIRFKSFLFFNLSWKWNIFRINLKMIFLLM